MENEKNYLEYLAELYPTIEKAATEIINLQSVINLPKGTEHFLSDIHANTKPFLMYSATVPVPCERRLTMSSATRSVFRKNVRLQPLSITRESAWRWRKSSRRISMTGTRSCCTA